MGIRKIFQKKDPTEEELVEDLNTLGISTRSKNKREEKFGAFKEYASQRQHEKSEFKPVNPYAALNGNQNGALNPYSQSEDSGVYNSSSGGSNPSLSNGRTDDPYSRSTNPYGRQSTTRSSRRSSPYESSGGARSTQENDATNASRTRGQTYDPYKKLNSFSTTTQPSRTRDFDEETLDLNAIPTNPMYVSTKPIKRQNPTDVDTLDLNALPEDDDLNVPLEELPEEDQVNSEDEEVDAIKQDIRFVKKESVNSTRNTLKMTQEADASAVNTLGMLGSQSERLYNAEQNLLLADTQTGIAAEKVKELERLNRSIFIPAYGNPFNKKSRLQQKEMKIKADKAQEKYMRDTNRQELYASEQRIKQGLTLNATSSDLYQKYQGEKDLLAAQRYQFENDSEDDEMEKEIASNLDQISSYAKKLKGSAKTMGVEVDSQNKRLGKIEEDADKLDINVHMNNVRLNDIH